VLVLAPGLGLGPGLALALELVEHKQRLKTTPV